jgi:hypothetical protein
MIENDIEAMFASPLKSVYWARRIPILDQGSLGSCTGNAGTGALGSEPFITTLLREEKISNAQDLDEGFAVDLYSAATIADKYGGMYPPDDTGSSGLAICQVLKRRATITGYRWARTPHGFARLLQDGPALLGMPWYNAFFYPSAGYIDADTRWESSGVAGGHEVEAIGLELDPINFYSSSIVVANSWGSAWGANGFFKMRMRTYETLRSCDLKQFIVK